MEAREPVEHPTTSDMVPTTENYLAQNISDADVEKPWCRVMAVDNEEVSVFEVYLGGRIDQNW